MDDQVFELLDEEELADAAEDLQAVLDAFSAGVLDASPGAQLLLAALLDDVQEGLASVPGTREALEIGGL